jgi:hypothetical protein
MTGEQQTCPACGNPVVAGPRTLYDVGLDRGTGSAEVIASAVPIEEVRELRRAHPGAGVAVHFVAEGAAVHFGGSAVPTPAAIYAAVPANPGARQ